MSSHGDEHTFVRQLNADSRVFAGGRTIPQPQLSTDHGTDGCDLQVTGVGIPCFPPVPTKGVGWGEGEPLQITGPGGPVGYPGARTCCIFSGLFL
jgi:hypothetical protein